MKRLIFGAAIFALVLAGCSSGKTLTGKWKVTSIDGKAPETSITAEYSDKDKLKISMLTKQRMSNNKSISIYGDIKGTYKLDGDKMTMTVDNVKFTCPDVPEEFKEVVDKQIRTLTEETKWKMNDEGSMAVMWIDDNTFSLTGKSGKPQTYTRVR